MPKQIHSNGENMPDVPFLTSEVARLSSAVSWWNTAILVMMVVAALAATGLVATQYIAFQRADNLAKTTEQLSELKERISGKKITDAGNIATSAQSTALDARGKVAGLEKAASDAKAAQQQVQIDLAKQQEKTALAEKSLLEVQKKLDWREISPSQRKLFLGASEGKRKGTVKILALSGDDEAKAYAEKLRSLLIDGGWVAGPITRGLLMSPVDVGLQVAINTKVPPTIVSDTQVSIPSDSPVAYGFDLITALQEANFVLTRHGIDRDGGKEDEVMLTVGSRP